MELRVQQGFLSPYFCFAFRMKHAIQLQVCYMPINLFSKFYAFFCCAGVLFVRCSPDPCQSQLPPLNLQQLQEQQLLELLMLFGHAIDLADTGAQGCRASAVPFRDHVFHAPGALHSLNQTPIVRLGQLSLTPQIICLRGAQLNFYNHTKSYRGCILAQ